MKVDNDKFRRTQMKKYIAILLMILLLVTITGCNKNTKTEVVEDDLEIILKEPVSVQGPEE